MIVLLAVIGLSGCVAYPVYESPRAYYAPAPAYGYYSYRAPSTYYYYNSRSHW
jgi:hypothetical protein